MSEELNEAINALYLDGKIDREIDRELGLRSGATAGWRRRTNSPPNGVPGRPRVSYTVTDGIRTVTGTAPECAAAFGIGVASFYHVVQRARRGKVKKYALLEVAA